MSPQPEAPRTGTGGAADRRPKPDARRRLHTTAALAACLVALAAGACGDDEGSEDSEAQPLPGASVFQEGGFDELPRYPGAEEASEPAVEDDVTTQSFTTASATPERVIQFYADELEVAGWTAVEEPGRIGADDTYRGVWEKDDRRLVVSATEFSGFDDPSAARTTQFNLNLGPA